MTDSVYLIKWDHMLKVGYTMNRRWQEVARRNSGTTVAVWHFTDSTGALDAEQLGHRIAAEWGREALAEDLRTTGYTECRVVPNPDRAIAEVTEALDSIAPRCQDIGWCQLTVSECL